MDKKKFAKAVLDKECENFVIHVEALEATLESAKMTISLAQIAQIAPLK